MRVFLIRHGDPDYSIDSLTAAGQREAAALAERLAAVGLDRVFSSPLGRAQATAQYTAERLGLPIETEDWTAEIGAWGISVDGGPRQAAWNIDGDMLRALPPSQVLPPVAGGLSDRRPPDGRRPDDGRLAFPALDVVGCLAGGAAAAADAYDRLCSAGDAFLSRLGYERDGLSYRVLRANTLRVALFCHGGFGLAWLSHLLQIPLPLMWSGFFLWPSSVTTILMDERRPGIAIPRCVGLADLSHLHAAGLPPQPSGIIANHE